MSIRKIIIFLMVVVISIPISIFFSNIVHLSLSGIAVDISNIEISYLLENLLNNENQFKIFLYLEILFVLFFITVLFIQGENVYETGLMKITDNISTPMPYGKGQHGTARWLTKKEYKKIFKCNILNLKKDIREQKFKMGGLVVGYEKNKKGNEEIYFINENMHSLILGATRSGKTRSIVLQTIGNLALAGENMIISDPKREIFDYTADFLKELGYETIAIDFKNKEKSNRYNFLQPIIDAVNENDFQKAQEYVWDLTTSLVGEDNAKSEKIWRDGEMSIIAGAIMTVVFENKDNPQFQNLTNVYSFISEMCKTENGSMPMNDYIKELDDSNPASRIFGIARIAPERTRGSFFTAALTTLRLFTNDGVYGMTCESDFSLKDTAKKKRAIFIIVQDETTTYYPLASLFVNQQYTSLVELADESGGRIKRRTNFILDEFGNFSTIPSFSNMLTVGGGRKIRFNMFLQSFSQLEQKYGKEGAENILDNSHTWVYLKTANTDTATKIMKKLGTYTTSTYSQSTSYSKNQSGSDSQSRNLISRPLLTEDEILRIQRPYVLVMNTGNYPAIVKIPDLSKWHFNKLYGLGDEDHNEQVRKERNDRRKVRKQKKVELWGIWNDYK